VAFNGDAVRELAAQFLVLAEKQGAAFPLMVGHRIVGISLLCTCLHIRAPILPIVHPLPAATICNRNK